MQDNVAENDLLVGAISSVVTTELLSAVAQGRWIDDLLVLEIADAIQKRFPEDIDVKTSRKIVYKCVAKASEHLDLGLRESSIQQLYEM